MVRKVRRLQVSEAKWLRELEAENAKLKMTRRQNGHRIKCLTIVDDVTRTCLDITVGYGRLTKSQGLQQLNNGPRVTVRIFNVESQLAEGGYDCSCAS